MESPAASMRPTLQEQLADALDAGAGALRRRASAAPAADGATEAPPAGELLQQGALAATLLEQGATWVRDADLGALEGRVVEQIEQHPMRTLAIAAAVGFLVGRRLR